MTHEELMAYVDKKAREQIELFGQPSIFNYEIAIKKAEDLAAGVGADATLAKIGTMLMDIKIGECMKNGKPETHVAESVKYSKKILEDAGVQGELLEFLLDLVRFHHGTDKYPSLEAEIVANADCYRFLTVEGAYRLIQTTGSWGWDAQKSFEYVISKIEEKHSVLSLPEAKRDLEPLYTQTKNWLENF